jgi:hypothetical protein
MTQKGVAVTTKRSSEGAPRTLRTGALAVAACACSGCASLLNPYLTDEPLDTAIVCAAGSVAARPPATEGAAATCDDATRLRGTIRAVESIKAQAANAVSDRAHVGSISSALAFPLAGALLYRGATVDTEAGRHALLAGGLAVGAVYESRNTLVSGSPLDFYQLANARLGCVLSQSTPWLIATEPTGAQCTGFSTKLQGAIDAAKGVTDPRLTSERDQLVSKATEVKKASIDARPQLLTALGAISGSARRIVADTNANLRVPFSTPSQAASFVQAQAQAFKPVEVPKQLDKGATGTAGDQDTGAEDLKKVQALAEAYNQFAQTCIVPLPKDTSAIEACTSYSPAAPAAAVITTTLVSTAMTLKPGGVVSFVATSKPTGTPRALYASNTADAERALGAIEQIGVTPTQTQITLRYANALPSTTDVVVHLVTSFGDSEPLAITLTLQGDAPGTTTTSSGGSGSSGTFTAVRADADLMKKLDVKTGATDNDIRSKLEPKWQALCKVGTKSKPTPAHLNDGNFMAAVKSDAKPDEKAAFCKSS